MHSQCTLILFFNNVRVEAGRIEAELEKGSAKGYGIVCVVQQGHSDTRNAPLRAQ